MAGDDAVLERTAEVVALPPAEDLTREVAGLLAAVAVALEGEGPELVRELDAGQAALVVDEAQVGAE